MTIVPDAFSLLRELLPNAASVLSLEADGREAHASGADELDILPPPQSYFYSDPPAAAGDAHKRHVLLEVPIGDAGKRLGAISLYRERGQSFDAEDADDLARVATYFEHALKNVVQAPAAAGGVVEDEAMLLATTRGEILFTSDSASGLLEQLASQEQQAFDRRSLPPFCMRLVEAVVHGDQYPWRMPACRLALAGGVLEARAQWMGAGAALSLDDGCAGPSSAVGIFLKCVAPLSLIIWRGLGSVELSPQQMEVAFWMAVGGGRESARARMDLSDAVLRDCVKVIYEKFGCTSEAGLLALLRPASTHLQ